MTRYRDVKGLSVVALAEGKKIGQIEDLVVDPEARAVRWLRLGSGMGSLFGGGPSSWLSVDAVHSIGEHAVTVKSAADVRGSGDVPEAVELVKGGRALLGKKVLTEGGHFLGETRDFTFDPDSFRLTSILLAQGSALSPQAAEIDAQTLQTIGQDLIIVAEGARVVTREEREPGESDRGLDSLFGPRHEKAPSRPVSGRETPAETVEPEPGAPRPFGADGPQVEPPVPQRGQLDAGEPYAPGQPGTGRYPGEMEPPARPGSVDVYEGDAHAYPPADPRTGRVD